jgi:hypothetical protein
MESYKYNKNMNIEYEGQTNSSDADKGNGIDDIPIDFVKARKQHKVIISGIEIYFPHPPYENQIKYMAKGIL